MNWVPDKHRAFNSIAKTASAMYLHAKPAAMQRGNLVALPLGPRVVVEIERFASRSGYGLGILSIQSSLKSEPSFVRHRKVKGVWAEGSLQRSRS